MQNQEPTQQRNIINTIVQKTNIRTHKINDFRSPGDNHFEAPFAGVSHYQLSITVETILS